MRSGILSGKSSSMGGRGFASISAFLCSILIAGCGAVPSSVSSTGTVPLGASGANISGLAFGGRQPIANATILLCEAGNTGYGSGTCNSTTNVASTTTGSNGTFTLSGYTCPTNTGLLYLKASGGVTVTGGAANPAAVLMAAIGACVNGTGAGSTQALTVNIDEATTAAGMAALAQFFNPANETIGSTSTNVAVGLTNAFATVPNLVTLSTGLAVTSTTVAGSGSLSTESITVTPDAAKINTIANVLAACINSNNTTVSPSTQCSTLFGDVNATPATDTLQADYYMATNPTDTVSGTSHVSTVYGLGSASGPYQTPTPYSSAPSDWTIAVTYGSNSENGSLYLFEYPQWLAVDSAGNIWVANNDESTETTGNSVTEMNAAGVALSQVLTSSLEGPSHIVIDPAGNIWLPNFGKSTALDDTVVEYTPTGSTTKTFTTGNGPKYLASDGQGDIFVLEPSYYGAGQLQEIIQDSLSGAPPTTIAGTLSTDFSFLTVDNNYNVWVSGGSTNAPPCTGTGTSSGCAAVYQFLYSGGAYPSTPSATYTGGGISAPELGLVVDQNNSIWNFNYGQSTLSEMSGTGTISSLSNSPFTTANLATPEEAAVDGAGNIWVADYIASSSGAIYEYAVRARLRRCRRQMVLDTKIPTPTAKATPPFFMSLSKLPSIPRAMSGPATTRPRAQRRRPTSPRS